MVVNVLAQDCVHSTVNKEKKASDDPNQENHEAELLKCTAAGIQSNEQFPRWYNEHFVTCIINMFLSLAPDYTEHIYSALNKTRKAASRASHEHSDASNQVVAVYSLATGVEQEDSAL